MRRTPFSSNSGVTLLIGRLLFLEEISHQVHYLAGIGMPLGGHLGIERVVIDGHFKLTAVGRDQGDLFDFRLKRF